jgi:hypothetical protein
MKIVSSDDDDGESFFDTVMILCQDSFSDSSSDGEDEQEEALFVWGDLHEEGLQTSSATVSSIHTCCSRIFGGPPQFTHTITSSFSLSFQSSCLMRFWSVFSDTTTIFAR